MREHVKATTVQTLIFDKKQFPTVASAQKWAKDHGFKPGTVKKADKWAVEKVVDVTANSIRIRQRPPGDFREGSFRTIELTTGVKAVIGVLKPGKKNARRQ